MSSPQRRVIVSGLKRQPVEYFSNQSGPGEVRELGIKQELALGDFFVNQDFDVQEVALEVEKDVCSGFGYVTFATVQDALKAVDACDGKPAPRLTGSEDAPLTVKRVKVATSEKADIAQQTLKVLVVNDALEREVRAIQARINEKKANTERSKDRSARFKEAIDLHEAEEKTKDLQAKLQELTVEEAMYEVVDEVTQKKTDDILDIRASIDSDQIAEFDKVAAKAAIDDPVEVDWGKVSESIKNGFIHYVPPRSTLTRAVTSGAETSYTVYQKPDSPLIATALERTTSQASRRSASSVISQRAQMEDLPRKILSQRMDIEEEAAKDPGFDPSKAWEGRQEAVIAETEALLRPCDICKLPVSSFECPWSEWDCSDCKQLYTQIDLVYSCQNQNGCQSIHDWGICGKCAKVQVGVFDGNWSGGSIAAGLLTWIDGRHSAMEIISASQFNIQVEEQLVTAVLKDDGKLHWSDGDVWEKITSPTPTPPISLGQAQRRVRLKNVPFFDNSQLQKVLAPELSRLWTLRFGRKCACPAVEMAETVQVDPDSLGKVHPALLNFMEVVIQFKYAEDAEWLVEGRQTRGWSTGFNLSVKGIRVDVEWAEPRARTDLRKLCYKVPSDQASMRSWQSKGTAQSNSTLIYSKVQSAPDVPKAKAAPAPPVAGRNSTIVIEGIPQGVPPKRAKQEVLELLKRLWEQPPNSLPFDAAEKLRGGLEGGIVTRDSSTCIVKFRQPVDAHWIMEHGRHLPLRITSGPRSLLKVQWAKPSGL